MCAQWKAKNVSNSREIEKLIQSLEEDISFGKEVKRSWGAGKGFDKNFPSWPNPFFPSFLRCIYYNTTVWDYNRQCSQKPLVEGKKEWNETKKRPLLRNGWKVFAAFSFFSRIWDVALYWALLQLKMLCRDFLDKFVPAGMGISEPFDWQKLSPLSSQHPNRLNLLLLLLIYFLLS